MMDCKKILVAVDGSENSVRAVSYTGEMVKDDPGVLVELLCIERLAERDLFPDEDSWKQRCKDQRDEMHDFLEDAAGILTGKGLAEKQVRTNYMSHCRFPLEDQGVTQCSMGTSIAQEVMTYSQDNGFGTIVVGRRGVSKAEEFLFGSVSNKIIHHARGCTVWVVG